MWLESATEALVASPLKDRVNDSARIRNGADGGACRFRRRRSVPSERGEAAKFSNVEGRGGAIIELVALATDAPNEMLPVSWGAAALRQ